MSKSGNQSIETTSENVWGERVKMLRDELGLTQAQFAERLGQLNAATSVSGATVNRWENGKIPQGKHWQSLLELANEEDYLRTFTGQTIGEVYLKKFRNDRDYLPQKGALGFVQTHLNRADDFREVLQLIWDCGGSLKRTATVEGRAAGERTQEDGAENPLAFLLFTLPDHASTMGFKERFYAMPFLINPDLQIRFSPNEIVR